MPEVFDAKINLSETPVRQGVDAYYKFLKELVGPAGNERVALFNTITSIDLQADAPLYNDYLIRAYADRVIKTVPLAPIGAADTSERYSVYYKNMLLFITARMDAELASDKRDQILQLEKDGQVAQKEMFDYVEDVETRWTTQAAKLGLDNS